MASTVSDLRAVIFKISAPSSTEAISRSSRGSRQSMTRCPWLRWDGLIPSHIQEACPIDTELTLQKSECRAQLLRRTRRTAAIVAHLQRHGRCRCADQEIELA